MAHCPYDRLADLETLLAGVRALAGLVEKRPGIFYVRGQGFLHFHVKGEVRWADVRDGSDWGEPIDMPEGAGARAQSSALAEIRRRLERTLAARR